MGEMIYRGPNVTLGYAVCGKDLDKGDEKTGYYIREMLPEEIRRLLLYRGTNETLFKDIRFAYRIG